MSLLVSTYKRLMLLTNKRLNLKLITVEKNQRLIALNKEDE